VRFFANVFLRVATSRRRNKRSQVASRSWRIRDSANVEHVEERVARSVCRKLAALIACVSNARITRSRFESPRLALPIVDYPRISGVHPKRVSLVEREGEITYTGESEADVFWKHFLRAASVRRSRWLAETDLSAFSFAARTQACSRGNAAGTSETRPKLDRLVNLAGIPSASPRTARIGSRWNSLHANRSRDPHRSITLPSIFPRMLESREELPGVKFQGFTEIQDFASP